MGLAVLRRGRRHSRAFADPAWPVRRRRVPGPRKGALGGPWAQAPGQGPWGSTLHHGAARLGAFVAGLLGHPALALAAVLALAFALGGLAFRRALAAVDAGALDA